MTEHAPIHHIDPTPAAIAAEQPVFDARSERQRQALQKLEEGTAAILTSEGFKQWIGLAARFHQYSLNNTILIMAQRPDATLVNAYERWKGLGRQVKRGEAGIKIFYPIFQKVRMTDPDTGDEVEHQVLSSFGIGNVFDVSQTEGDPLPTPPDVRDHLETDDRATALNLKLSRFLLDQGVRLSTEAMPGHRRGSWNPDRNLIALRQTDGGSPFAVGRTRTLVHEAAHYLADHRGQVSREDAEAVAEGAAYVAMTHFGIDLETSSFAYIAGWSSDKQLLKRNLGEIQKIGSKLIAAVEGVGDPYAEGFGSWEAAQPWARSEQRHAQPDTDAHCF